MKILFSILLACVFSYSASSQSYSLNGKIFDTENQALIGANVILLNDTDEIQYQSSTNMDGQYVIDGIEGGVYRLKVSYLGYFSIYKDLTVNDDIVYETLQMYESPVEMDEIIVEGKVPLAIQKGDTTSYSASQYKVLKDASTEDLISKLPGVVIQNGTIQTQGENVTQVFVDGKPFFGNDPNAALKNLPAEVVDRIEIFDKKSEQAEFTGFDDGETTKTINIVTKIDKRNGQFGKIYAAYGSENHYNAGGNTSFFNGNQRISIIGQTNDINIQNFSSEDILGISGSSGRRGGRRGGGGSRGGSSGFQVPQQSGISSTNAIGLNFSNEWTDKGELSFSYFVNQSNTLSEEFLERAFFNSRDSENDERYIEGNVSETDNVNHRLSGRLDYKFNSKTSINIRPNISYQNNDGLSATDGRTFFGQDPINSTGNNFESLYKGWNVNNNAILRHRFGASRRTLSLNVRSTYNNQSGNSALYSLNQFFQPLLSNEILDQISDYAETGWTNTATASFTNPLGKKGMLGVEYRLTLQNEDSDQETFNKTENGSYDQLENILSSIFTNDYTTHSGGLSYNYRVGKSMIMARASLQYAQLLTDQVIPFESNLDRSFLNVVPFVMWRYNIDRQNNIRFIYRTNTRKPTVSQLQEVINNSNPLQLSIGNSSLDQQYQHSLFARVRRSNSEKGTVLYALIGGNVTNNYIGNSLYTSRSDNPLVQELALSPGTQLNKTVNLDGYWDFRTFFTYGMPVYPLKSNLNFNLSANFANIPGYINDELNKAKTTTYGLGVVISSNFSDKVDFSLGSNTSYNGAENDINANQNTQYINQRTTAKFNWVLPGDFVFRTDASNQFFTGLSDGFNENYWIWNLAIGRKVFKSRLAELNISVYDLLNQNQRINRDVTANYVQDIRTNVLQRYVMLNFIYNFRNYKSAKESNIKSEEEKRKERMERMGF